MVLAKWIVRCERVARVERAVDTANSYCIGKVIHNTRGKRYTYHLVYISARRRRERRRNISFDADGRDEESELLSPRIAIIMNDLCEL